MERFIRLLIMVIAMVFGIVKSARAEQFLTLPLDNPNPYIYQGWTYNTTDISGTTVHEGIDFDCDSNDPILAAADGVAMAAYGGGYGYFVRILHDNGMETMYAHLTSYISSIPYKGNTTAARNSSDYDTWFEVKRGDVIGYCGNTETGTIHLHFELTTGGYGGSCDCRVDPYDIRSTDVDYPDSNTTASCGSNYYWTECPPVPADEAEDSSTLTLVMLYVDDTTVTAYSHTTEDGAPQYELYDVVLEVPNTVTKWFVSDLDQDGYDDLIAAINSSDNTTRTYDVYLSDGAGNFDDYGTWLSMNRSDADVTFFGNYDNDGYPDLISGKEAQSNGSWQWTVYQNTTGTDFNDSGTLWDDSFGQYHDIFLVGDLTGNGQIELYRGQENDGETQGGDGNCTSSLNWRQLKPDGTNTSVSDDWGYSASQYLVGQVDDDTDKDEIIQVQTCDDTVPVYVRNLNDGTLSGDRWAQDVGSTSGTFYLGTAYWDDYPDLIRWGTSNLIALENYDPGDEDHRKFRGADNSDTLVESFPLDDEQLLFGTFGSITTTTTQAIAGSTVTEDEESYSSLELTSIAAADLTDVWSSPTCVVDSFGDFYAITLGQDQRLYEFERINGVWSSTALTSTVAMPLTASATTPYLFVDPDTDDRYITFMGDNARIELLHYNGSTWTAAELTSLVAAPLADDTTSPMGYVVNGTVYVVYQGNDQRIWWFTYNGSSYTSLDLTGRAAVEYAMPGTSPTAVYNEATGEHYIVFQGVNQRIQELIYNGSSWRSVELTSVVNSDLLDSYSHPMVYVDPFTGYVYTVINGVNERIDLLSDYHNNSYNGEELTSFISSPLAEPHTSPTGYIHPLTGNHVITFLGDDLRVYQYESDPWGATDLTGQIAVTYAAPTSPNTCVDPTDGTQYTVFTGDNARVQYIRYGP